MMRTLLFFVLMVMVAMPVMAQTEEATAEVTPLPVASEVGATVSGTVVMPPDAGTISLVSIGQIDGNTLVVSGFLLIGLMMMSLLAVAWKGMNASKDNTSTEAINQVLDGAISGLLQVWDKVGADVSTSPSKGDDALYAIADIPVEALTEYLKGLGLEVRPSVSGDVDAVD